MNELNYRLSMMCLYACSMTNLLRWSMVEREPEGCVFDFAFASLFVVLMVGEASKIKMLYWDATKKGGGK